MARGIGNVLIVTNSQFPIFLSCEKRSCLTDFHKPERIKFGIALKISYFCSVN